MMLGCMSRLTTTYLNLAASSHDSADIAAALRHETAQLFPGLCERDQLVVVATVLERCAGMLQPGRPVALATSPQVHCDQDSNRVDCDDKGTARADRSITFRLNTLFDPSPA